MLTKKTPDTIPAVLKVTAMGVENSLRLTYHNRSNEEFEAYRRNPENFKSMGDDDASALKTITAANANMVLFLVKSFDDGTAEHFPLNYDGLVELEDTWPGTLIGIVRGYHQARAAKVEKN